MSRRRKPEVEAGGGSDGGGPEKVSRRRFLRAAGWTAAGVAGTGILTAVGIPAVQQATKVTPPVSAPLAPDPLRIDHVTVVDPLHGTRHQDVSVAMAGGVITAVGRNLRGEVRTIVDGAGRYVVPGYNNMHSHVLQAEHPQARLASMLAQGVTGFRQMAGSAEMLRYRSEGRFPLNHFAPGLLGMPGALIMPPLGTVEEAEAEIRAQVGQGADFIKITHDDPEVWLAAVAEARARGLRTAGHLSAQITTRQASEAGFDCFEHFGTGSPVWIDCSARRDELVGHDHTGMPVPDWLLETPGVKQIVAGSLEEFIVNPALGIKDDEFVVLDTAVRSFDESRARELARLWARNGTWQVPTMVRLRTQYLAAEPEYQDDPVMRLMTDREADSWRKAQDAYRELPVQRHETFRVIYDRMLQLTRICQEEGVRLMAGTDGSAGTPGQAMQQELEQLAAAGLSPLEVLRSATTSPAEYLGRAGAMGRVLRGMPADLVLLDGDPLADARALGAVSGVVRAGHHHTRDELDYEVDRLLSLA